LVDVKFILGDIKLKNYSWIGFSERFCNRVLGFGASGKVPKKWQKNNVGGGINIPDYLFFLLFLIKI